MKGRAAQLFLGKAINLSGAIPKLQHMIGAVNLINVCLGGRQEPWTVGAVRLVSFECNFYIPDSHTQNIAQFPCTRCLFWAPISLTFEAKFRM